MSAGVDIINMMQQPYWWEAAPRELNGSVPLPADVDVLIVGAGYAGLSAGLTLARAGRSVVALDAAAPGFGGSSRSGGMVGHGHRLSYSKLIETLGQEKAQAILRDGIASLDFVTNLIDREGIDAQFRRVGRFRGAATPRDYEEIARDADRLTRDLGLPIEVVPRAEQHREIATDLYHGGLVFPTHGGLHPALFHQGLLVVARAAGVGVAGHTPVRGITRDGDQFRVATPRGEVRARDVIVATNGYTPSALTPFARRVVAMPSYLIATERLGANRVRALVPNGRMLVETAASHLYFRPSPDGERIVLGGRAALHPIPLTLAARRLGDWMLRVFPTLDGVHITHVWTGNVAMTRTNLPGVGRRDGIWYTIGCNGSGVAMMPYLGHKMALRILGNSEGATSFDDLPLPPVPFVSLRPLLQRALSWWWRGKDVLAQRA